MCFKVNRGQNNTFKEFFRFSIFIYSFRFSNLKLSAVTKRNLILLLLLMLILFGGAKFQGFRVGYSFKKKGKKTIFLSLVETNFL